MYGTSLQNGRSLTIPPSFFPAEKVSFETNFRGWQVRHSFKYNWPMPLQLYLFGSPRIAHNDEIIPFRRRKGLALLTYLAVTQRPQSRETLLGLLWPEFSADSARNNLRRELSLLKKKLGQPVLRADSAQIGLDRAVPLLVDVASFQTATEGMETTAVSTPEQVAKLTTAVNQYEADFLEGFNLPDCHAFEEWQLAQAAELRHGLGTTLAALVAWHQQQAEFELALQFARRWLELDTLHEEAHRQLMTLYAQAGQQAAALRQYESCARLLAEELGVEPEEETVALYTAIKSREIVSVAKSTNVGLSVGPTIAGNIPATRPITQLPVPTTPLIGRETEKVSLITELCDEAIRLVTIQGVGGMGKTRLALAVSHALAEQGDATPFVDGIYFVPLAPLNQASDVLPKLAETFGLTSSAIEIETLVLNFLRQKQLLLVLDNFEHLLAGTAVVQRILSQAPHVTCLVTSRERLRLSGERLFSLTGLSLTADDVSDSGAAQLFLDRVQHYRPLATLTEADQQAVARICVLVQGMPLALILAAGWADMLSLAEIGDEIGRSLDILSGEMHDIPERQQSMRAIFDSSWERLTTVEQQAFALLSVFRGGFGREAAAEVAQISLPILRRLVNKSLIQPQPNQDRYEIHELLRQIGAEKLAEQGEELENGRRHATYFLKAIAKLEDGLKGGQQLAALKIINRDFANIRHAWRWAALQKDVELLRTAEMSLFIFFDIYSRYVECLDLYRTALSQIPTSPFAQRLLLRIVYLRSWLMTETVESIDLSLLPTEAIEEGDDLYNQAFLAMAVGFVHMFKKQAYQEALGHLQTAVQRFKRLDDTFFTTNLLQRIAYCYGNLAQTEPFFTHMHQSFALAEASQNDSDMMKASGNLVMGNFMLGNMAESVRYAELNLTLAEKIGTQIQLAFGWAIFAFPLFAQGRIDEAYRSLTKAYKIAEIASFFITLGYANAGLALYHGMGGNREQARFHLRQGWACNPNAITAGMLNWAAALIAVQAAELAETRKRLMMMLTVGLMGQVSGFLLVVMPIAIVYLVETEAYTEAAALLGLMQEQGRELTAWVDGWQLFVERQEMLLGSWGDGVENGRSLELFSMVTGLLGRMQN